MIQESGTFNDMVCSKPYYKIYSKLAEGVDLGRIVTTGEPCVGVTQHRREDGSYTVVAINYTDKPVDPRLDFKENKFTALYGSADMIDACDAAIFKVEIDN